MQCPNCGAQTNGKFCEYCGSEMPRIAPETVNNDNSNTTNTTNTSNTTSTTIINNYYQSSSSPIRQSGNKQSFDAQPQPRPKTPFWKKNWFLVLLCIFVPYIGIFVLWAAKKPSKLPGRILISIILIGVSIAIFASSNGNGGGNQKENDSIWLEGYTDISDFKYYIDGNEIFLTDFHSNKKKVRINSSYTIDGKTCNVVSLDGVFTSDNVTSVIIPEGVRSVAANEFKSCGVKFLYLPSTLQNIGGDSFWSYFKDVEKIYYGGSEEQWKQLCTVERSKIDTKQIVFEANPDDLK